MKQPAEILVLPVFYQNLPVSAILVQILVNTSIPVSSRMDKRTPCPPPLLWYSVFAANSQFSTQIFQILHITFVYSEGGMDRQGYASPFSRPLSFPSCFLPPQVNSALGKISTWSIGHHWLIRHNFSCFLFQWVDAPDTSCMHTNWFNPVYVPVPSFGNTPTILVILVL